MGRYRKPEVKIVQKGKVNVLMNNVNITVINKSFNGNSIYVKL